jgi:hypothetical protein
MNPLVCIHVYFMIMLLFLQLPQRHLLTCCT